MEELKKQKFNKLILKSIFIIFFIFGIYWVGKEPLNVNLQSVANNSSNDEVIVYKIIALDESNNESVLKYEIAKKQYCKEDSTQTPDYQVKYFSKMPEYCNYKITYKILKSGIDTTKHASEIAQKYIYEYRQKFGKYPPEQSRQLPVLIYT